MTKVNLSHSQNFINNKRLAKKIASYAAAKSIDTIIEIGPGNGAITDELVKLNKQIIAIEADKNLYVRLKDKYKDINTLTLINKDFLAYRLPQQPFIIVANIPFNITADIIRKITSENSGLKEAYLVVQKEAAEKYAIGKSNQLLSIILTPRFKITIEEYIARSNFTPRLKYDAAIIHIQKRAQPVFKEDNEERFKDLLAYLFGRSKPILKDALKGVFSNLQIKLVLEHLNKTPTTKIKQLDFDEWKYIYSIFIAHTPPKSKNAIKGKYKKLLMEQKKLQKVHRQH